MPSAGVT
jgi:hypothetical protein